MRFLIYAATLFAALTSVVMGVNLVSAPPVRLAARPPAEPIRHEAAPQPVPSPPVAQQPASSQPRQAASPPPSRPEQMSAQEQQAPACNVAACTAAYRSFTASDCTYQPSEGPRRLCTRK